MAKNTEKENETAASAENSEKEAGKEAGPAVDPALEMVDVFVERDPSDENPNLVIGINGKNWVMPRGESSRVPRYVADEYKRARAAQYKADKTVNEMRGIKMAQAEKDIQWREAAMPPFLAMGGSI